MTTTLLRRALFAATALTAGVGAAPTTVAAAGGVTRACLVTSGSGEMDCYASESAMYAAHPELDTDTEVRTRLSAPAQRLAVVAAAACSGQVKLYTGTNYTGTLYTYTQTGSWINLGTAPNNAISSYKIGACTAAFREDPSGGGVAYPGTTSAGTNSPSMATGWDNRISSIS